MKTPEKFNAVQYMREQRDKLSQKLWDMKPDEIVEYFGRKYKDRLEQAKQDSHQKQLFGISE